MPRRTADLFSLWTAPLELARTSVAVAETAMQAQAVIAARMPIIANAWLSPWTADGRELSLMVSEKVDAAGRASRSPSAARLRSAAGAQARAIGRLGGGDWFGPADWMRMAEASFAMAAAMVTMPGEMVRPFHAGVTANARRLGRRAT